MVIVSVDPEICGKGKKRKTLDNTALGMVNYLLSRKRHCPKTAGIGFQPDIMMSSSPAEEADFDFGIILS